MNKKYILIGVGVLLVGGGIAYYFLSKKKESADLGTTNSVDIQGGTLSGASMEKPFAQTQPPFRQTAAIKTVGRTPISASSFPQKKG